MIISQEKLQYRINQHQARLEVMADDRAAESPVIVTVRAHGKTMACEICLRVYQKSTSRMDTGLCPECQSGVDSIVDFTDSDLEG